MTRKAKGESARPKRSRPKHDPGRRRFLGTFGKGVIVGAVVSGIFEGLAQKGVDVVTGVLGSLMRNMAAPVPSPSSYRHGFIRERLLGLNGLSYLNPGDLRVRLGKEPIPEYLSHDRAALAPLKALLARVTYLETPFMESSPGGRDSIVSSGSPVSNDISGLYLPVYPLGDDPSPERTLVVSPDAVPYHFATGDSYGLEVISGSEGGRQASKRNNAIVEWHEGKRIRRPNGYLDTSGRLGRDYLLLTRVPRTPAGGEILVIAGLHGPATQAFELLFRPEAFPDDELRYLADCVGDEPYFQIVLEAFDIAHEPPMSTARKLAVSRLLPPQAIHITTDFFRLPPSPPAKGNWT